MEDFTTYTEVDPNNHISKTASRITFAALSRNESAYVYSDKGVDHFSGDFEHLLTICITAENNGDTFLWVMANDVADAYVLSDGSHRAMALHWYDPTHALYLQQYYIGGNVYDGSIALTAGTVYYLKIRRDESEGTYGTLYCYIYSNAARTNLLDTLTVTLAVAKYDYRYIYGLNSYNGGVSSSTDGYTENLNLQEVVAHYKTVTEILGMADTISKKATFHRTYTEILGLKDTISKKAAFHRTYTEILGFVDTIHKPVARFKTVTEALGMADRVQMEFLLKPPRIIVTVNGKVIIRISRPCKKKPDYLSLS